MLAYKKWTHTISFYSHKNITLKPQKKLTRFLVILKYNKYILFK